MTQESMKASQLFYKIKRVRINQPSALQDLHCLHGKVGIAVPEPTNDKCIRIFFVEGLLKSIMVPKNVVSII